jgi:DNA-directed RNA polymerase specialized sigma24 family protein
VSPLVKRLGSYLDSDDARAAFERLRGHEEALRPLSNPRSLTWLLRSTRTPDDLRQALLRGLFAATDAPDVTFATAVLTLALQRGLRKTLRRIETISGDADNELALAVCEYTNWSVQPPSSYLELRRCVAAKLRALHRGKSTDEAHATDEGATHPRAVAARDVFAAGQARRLAESLPHIDREIVLGVSVLGESHLEVASRLGLTVGATWFRHTRALRSLATQLEREARSGALGRGGRRVPFANRRPLSFFGGRIGPERKRSRCPTSGSRPTTSPTSTRPVAVPG